MKKDSEISEGTTGLVSKNILLSNNKQTNFYLRSDNNMLHMSRYNMYNNISYRGGCAKKYIFIVDSADTQGRKTVSSTSSNRRRSRQLFNAASQLGYDRNKLQMD